MTSLSSDLSGGLPAGRGPALRRHDLLLYEPLLREDLARVLPFTAHALYFPTGDEASSPVWLPDEKKLLLPLRWRGEFLAMLLLREPDPAATAALLPYLPGMVELCLEKLALHKSSRTDALTGLATREVLLERLARELGNVRRAFASVAGWESGEGPAPAVDRPQAAMPVEPGEGTEKRDPVVWQASLGIVTLHLAGLRNASRACGHGLAERLLGQLGESLRRSLPEEILAARTGDAEFALLVPGAARAAVESAAANAVRALESVRLVNPLTGMPVRVSGCAGYALFPQDWTDVGRASVNGEDGWESAREAEEAADLLDKARLAARRVFLDRQGAGGSTELPGDAVLGYGAILPRGGIVDQILPFSRVHINLGRDVGAREGQRFSVWSFDYPVQGEGGGTGATGQEPLYKGEIVLADVREESSQADILLLGDPAWPLAPGDRLALLPEEDGAFQGGKGSEAWPGASPDSAGQDASCGSVSSDACEQGAGGNLTAGEGRERADGISAGAGRPDPFTGLYRHGDFLARLAVARTSRFGLVLARFGFPASDAEGRAFGSGHGREHGMAEAAGLLRRLLAEAEGHPGETGRGMFAGRYSLNAILLYHPDLDAETAQRLYPSISEELSCRLGISVAMGVACVPWLTYRAPDALECCRKALDYALLLPAPHVGIFDSLAINISADRRYSQGDVFGAMEEYRLALLADDGNTLAWNSLGVCLAGLGRRAEARRAFEQAVERAPEDPAGHYNLGAACASLGDAEGAAASFEACLRLAPNHPFVRLRLGELAEARRDGAAARRLYEEALTAAPDSPQPYRCLARLELQEGRSDKARERLHQALLRHPQDPFSLQMLARLYLDGGEDAELAETLARQSVALRPDRRSAWLELARALEEQGRRREAHEARVRAGEV